MYAWRKCTLFCVKKVCGMFAGLRKISTFASAIAEIAQLVEHNLAKVRVASSSLVFRSEEKTALVVFSFFMCFSSVDFFWISLAGIIRNLIYLRLQSEKGKSHENV